VSRTSVILRNITSNWVGFAVNAAVTLILTPFVLRELGAARYGIWILTSSFVGYYGFLDLGFRTGVVQYLTRYLAVNDYERGSDCISSAVSALSVLSMVMVILSLGGAVAAPYLFALPPGTGNEAFWCILIVGISSAAQCVLSPFSAIFTAKQRFDLTNMIGIGTRLLTAGGIFVALKAGYGLVGVSGAFCGANVIDYVTRWRVSRYLAPELDVSWRRASRKRFREIASFGGWNFLISLNSYIYSYVPNLLIGAFMPIAAVGYYALATGLLRNVNSILTPVGQVIYPVSVELHARGDKDELVRMYHEGSRLMIILTISIVLVSMFWAEDFYRLWVGEKYISGKTFSSVALLFQILIISTFTTYISSIAGQILVGAGHVRIIAIALICGSIINVSLSVLLIRPFGLIGIAFATVIASIIIDLITIPILLQKTIGLSVKDFALSACIRPAFVGVIQILLFYFIRLAWKPLNWSELILQGTVAAVCLSVTVFAVGLKNSERDRFILKPLQRLIG